MINYELRKPIARGKNLHLREVEISDAEFILSLRVDPNKNKFLSYVESNLEQQKNYIEKYKLKLQEYYFLICFSNGFPIGTVRIYDIREDSFCWGSWILSDEAHINSAVESALLLYDFAFYSLHFKSSHFDVRKENLNVIKFHQKFGAEITHEDGLNFYFKFTLDNYERIRQKYKRILP
jgi:RimJ/RimL family protein N-acetyltransferase